MFNIYSWDSLPSCNSRSMSKLFGIQLKSGDSYVTGAKLQTAKSPWNSPNSPQTERTSMQFVMQLRLCPFRGLVLFTGVLVAGCWCQSVCSLSMWRCNGSQILQLALQLHRLCPQQWYITESGKSFSLGSYCYIHTVLKNDTADNPDGRTARIQMTELLFNNKVKLLKNHLVCFWRDSEDL